jgi:hypothetical protein
MAKQNRNPKGASRNKDSKPSSGKPSILEQSRTKCDKYMNYEVAAQKAADPNPDNSGVVKLAQEFIPEKYIPERETIKKYPEIATKAFKYGFQIAGEDFENYVSDNLKTIIDGIVKNKGNLETLLANMELKEAVKSNKPLRIHKDFQELYKNLADYQNKDAEDYEQKKAQALEYMKGRVNSFYESDTNLSKEQLEVLKDLSNIDEELKFVRTNMFKDEKREELIKETGDNLHTYLSKSAKGKMPFYMMVCNVGRKSK